MSSCHNVTSWRHGMTLPHLFSLSQLVDVLERWFFVCFYDTLGCWFRKCCHFCICMMTSRHDVMSWRQKTGCTLSQLVVVLERWFFFCFYNILGCQVQKYHRFRIFICHSDAMTSWHDYMTSQNSHHLHQRVEWLDRWFDCCPCIHGCYLIRKCRCLIRKMS